MAKSNQFQPLDTVLTHVQYKAITYAAELIQIAEQQLGFGKHGISLHLDFLQWVHVNLWREQNTHTRAYFTFMGSDLRQEGNKHLPRNYTGLQIGIDSLK